MGGDRGISGGSCQVLSLLEWDVLSFTVFVAFGKTKINDVDVVTSSVCASNEEIIWLDITMDDSLLVNLLNAADELHCNHQNSL